MSPSQVSLGLRCSTSEFSFVVIEGSQKTHVFKSSGRVKYPSGYSHSELLKWLYNEIGVLISKYHPNCIGLKGTEAVAMKGKSFGDRTELEAMVFLQAAQNGITEIERKVSVTIAKDLGLKGKGKQLLNQFDYSSIPNYKQLTQHIQEATQVALSMI